MPRKENVQQNRYIKNAKIDEPTTEHLFILYFSEIAMKNGEGKDYTRDHERGLLAVNQYAQKLSKPTIGEYFKKFSKYLWTKLLVATDPAFEDEHAFDELLSLIYDEIEDLSPEYISSHQFLREKPIKASDKDPVGRSLLFHYLKARSNAVRGFKKDNFKYEFGRVHFICSVVESYKIQYTSLSKIYEDDIAQAITRAAISAFGTLLMEAPLDDAEKELSFL